MPEAHASSPARPRRVDPRHGLKLRRAREATCPPRRRVIAFPRMGRPPIPTWYFALAVVRLGRRFLLMQEKKYGESWSIPGGRVEAGESLESAAVREVMEETGIPIRLEGVLRVEHAASPTTSRVRVIYVASPTDDRAPKSVPDEESLCAAWLTLDEIGKLKLRGADLRALLEMVAQGAPIYPLELIGRELSV